MMDGRRIKCHVMSIVAHVKISILFRGDQRKLVNGGWFVGRTLMCVHTSANVNVVTLMIRTIQLDYVVVRSEVAVVPRGIQLSCAWYVTHIRNNIQPFGRRPLNESQLVNQWEKNICRLLRRHKLQNLYSIDRKQISNRDLVRVEEYWDAKRQQQHQ